MGDLEPEVVDHPVSQKPRQDQGSIRDDVDEILNGTSSVFYLVFPTSCDS